MYYRVFIFNKHYFLQVPLNFLNYKKVIAMFARYNHIKILKSISLQNNTYLMKEIIENSMFLMTYFKV